MELLSEIWEELSASSTWTAAIKKSQVDQGFNTKVEPNQEELTTTLGYGKKDSELKSVPRVHTCHLRFTSDPTVATNLSKNRIQLSKFEHLICFIHEFILILQFMN